MTDEKEEEIWTTYQWHTDVIPHSNDLWSVTQIVPNKKFPYYLRKKVTLL
jgi:hypothetical protein